MALQSMKPALRAQHRMFHPVEHYFYTYASYLGRSNQPYALGRGQCIHEMLKVKVINNA